ncbi:ADP-ribosylglycohydrolase family protein [Streptomyces sp. S9]|nr:ADP-ribosylglycohydrolase family protein [Streptomyces sp. S9]
MDPATTARRSLEGLSLGDAFGERWFPLFRPPRQAYAEIRARRTPPEPHWYWTDDTAMALGVLRVLDGHGEIRRTLLRLHREPDFWFQLVCELFGGGGSAGKGEAMRVAPSGAWFHTCPDRVAEQTVRSTEVTHAHPEDLKVRLTAASVRREPTLEAVTTGTPDSTVREGPVRADDTVPFALWCAARHSGDLVSALWAAAEGLGDVDTACAIAGGVVAARTGVEGVPGVWLERREALAGVGGRV